MNWHKGHDWTIEGEPSTGGQHVGANNHRYRCRKCDFITEYSRKSIMRQTKSDDIPVCTITSTKVEVPCCVQSNGIIKCRNGFYFMEIYSWCGEFKQERMLKHYITYCCFCGKKLVG